jgi:peptidoglycan/LPS O-acetylase OafA/YrhL
MVVVSVIFFTKIPLSHLEQFSASVSTHANGEFVPSLLLVQNFVQFDQILGPLWSLPYEVQTYCLFPMVYLFLRRFDSAKILIWGWTVLAAVDTAFAPHLMKYAKLGRVLVVPDMLFFFLLFLAGLCAFKEMPATHPELPFWVLPTLLPAICVLWLFSRGQWTMWLLLSLGLGLTVPHIRRCRIQSLGRFSGWIAKYSYGIYLLHSPAIWLGFIRLSHLGLVVRIGTFLLTTLGGSVLLYHVLEHPMIVVGNKLAAVIARKKPTRALAIVAGGA